MTCCLIYSINCLNIRQNSPLNSVTRCFFVSGFALICLPFHAILLLLIYRYYSYLLRQTKYFNIMQLRARCAPLNILSVFEVKDGDFEVKDGICPTCTCSSIYHKMSNVNVLLILPNTARVTPSVDFYDFLYFRTSEATHNINQLIEETSFANIRV